MARRFCNTGLSSSSRGSFPIFGGKAWTCDEDHLSSKNLSLLIPHSPKLNKLKVETAAYPSHQALMEQRADSTKLDARTGIVPLKGALLCLTTV